MAINKEHKEFHALDMSSGWETPAGYPAGIEQKILSGALDEKSKRGSRSRLLRFAPGIFTTKPFVHEYWEEVYLVSGDLTVGNDEQGKGGEIVRTEHLCIPAARRLARSVQVRERLPAIRNPLFRSGLKSRTSRRTLSTSRPQNPA